MKKKIFLLVFVIFLTFTLVGCSGVVTPPLIHENEDILRVVNNYWLALSNREYELAKIYCILNGNAYQAAEEYQDMPYFESSTMMWTCYFNDLEANGNSAEMNINLTLTVTVCFDDICSSESETINNFIIHLTKIGGVWKLE